MRDPQQLVSFVSTSTFLFFRNVLNPSLSLHSNTFPKPFVKFNDAKFLTWDDSAGRMHNEQAFGRIPT